MSNPDILIAGGGIAGLSLALTLHQIGVSSRVYEAVETLKPLGVGINLQPNAIRELFDMGITREQMDQCGLPAKEWALVGLNGKEIYSEPRGEEAGYNWPQYAVHRGQFHMMLFEEVRRRLGPDAVQTGARVIGYEKTADGVSATVRTAQGDSQQAAQLLIAADGIHSQIRAQMVEGPDAINWGGVLMWRGVTRARPIRTGSSFVGLGTHKHRMVIYPISKPDADGLALINWIAEITVDDSSDWTKQGWFLPVSPTEVAPQFEQFRYDWLDVPQMILGAEVAFENPMIDRTPLKTWVDGPVALMGDAAHAMYPTGSNGASQAIVDARTLGAKLRSHGITQAALSAYDDQLCAPVSSLQLRNRGSGPFGMLNIVDQRCGGVFDDIEAVFPAQERSDFMADYKSAAGFAIDSLNAAPPILAI
ncbi:MAG: flavin-dependent oxidoreductase [Pelagimonas sp.]|jgi:2-polyprenyl-6-methoxyphenol hydroxylase-like FAD-dependent oxidoreductase|nr:flavin-dependent oxidoreductase [Pelagimonas sp.]